MEDRDQSINLSPITTRSILSLIVAISISSCASSSHEIAATYVSPTQYAAFNCDQLSLELARLNQRRSELAANIDTKASSDEGMTAVSIIFFWPAAFALGGNQAQEAEYARLKGEYDAVQKAGIEKNCKLDPGKSGISPIVKNYGTGISSDESVYEFYGLAEEELNNGDVDRNLWARALVEAEGDEIKRKAKYIELRANELHIEKYGTSQSLAQSNSLTSHADLDNYDFAGTYQASITGKHVSPDFRNSKFKVELSQQGDKLTGTFGTAGKIWGDIEDESIEFEWFSMGGWNGKGTWEIDLESNTFKGEWSNSSTRRIGEWNMTKTQ